MRRRGAALVALALLTAPATAAAPRGPSGRPPFSSALLQAPTALRDRPRGRVIARLAKHTEWGSPRVVGVTGRRGSWLRVMVSDLSNGRTGWIPTRRVVQFAVDWRVDVSLARREVVVRRAGRVMRRVAVAVGGAATPTPLGHFAVTDKLHFRAASAYGYGALALSAHQPAIVQGWGGGDRIAIHGTSSPGSVGLAVSHGCLRAGRTDIIWLVQHVPLGTPVFVRS
jgi:hypothetical protein